MKTFKQFLAESPLMHAAVEYAVQQERRRQAMTPEQIAAKREKRQEAKRVASTTLGFGLGSAAGALTGTPAGILGGGAAGAYLGRKIGKRVFEAYLAKQRLDKKTMTPETVAKKHKVPLSQIMGQLRKGIGVEHEHTSDAKLAREIALDHLREKPNYYDLLKKVEGGKS